MSEEDRKKTFEEHPLTVHIQPSTVKALLEDAIGDRQLGVQGDALNLFTTLIATFTHEVLMRSAMSGANLGRKRITDDDLRRILAQTLIDLCI
ncbi:hypothetical protein WR25_11108 [Diploscapter pachys]|uniref:Uncharacterized protein n=1 Tax=Diploscapter pachys TaxID=2018661 RepID=A0A2A2L7G2_9BILA|nr:hypothetical protein WR25_14371 [Diploscapter pachys]PAV82068.1 hypothetical protein WR25_11108 [Diploscapter pachys]